MTNFDVPNKRSRDIWNNEYTFVTPIRDYYHSIEQDVSALNTDLGSLSRVTPVVLSQKEIKHTKTPPTPPKL